MVYKPNSSACNNLSCLVRKISKPNSVGRIHYFCSWGKSHEHLALWQYVVERDFTLKPQRLMLSEQKTPGFSGWRSKGFGLIY